MHIAQVNKHPKVMFIIFWFRWLTTSDTRLPTLPVTLGFDLNVNRATFITVARDDIDLWHISSKSHGECTAFV